jgi:hypothetical protein
MNPQFWLPDPIIKGYQLNSSLTSMLPSKQISHSPKNIKVHGSLTSKILVDTVPLLGQMAGNIAGKACHAHATVLPDAVDL